MTLDLVSRTVFPQIPQKLNPWEKTVQVIISTFVFFALFVVYRNQISMGAHWDVGWIKHVIWRNPLQEMPNSCCALDGENSIFIAWSWHSIPLFSIFSLISFVFPFGQQVWLITFLALPYAIIVYSVIYFGLTSVSSPRARMKILFVSLFSTIVALSFGVFRSIYFPHYEIYFCSFLLLFLYYLQKTSKLPSILSLLLCISVKEDSAFYLVILYMVFFWQLESKRKLIANSLLLLSSSLIYLILLSFVSFTDPPNPSFPNQTALESQYLGSPAFRHLTADFLYERIRLNVVDNLLLYLLIALLLLIAKSPAIGYSPRVLYAVFPHVIVALIGIASVKGGWAVYHQIPIWTTVLLFLIYFQMHFQILNRKVFLVPLLTLCISSLLSTSSKYIYDGINPPYDRSLIDRNVQSVINQAVSRGDILDTNFFVYNSNKVSIHSWLREYTDFKNGMCLVSLNNSNSISKLSEITGDRNPKITFLAIPFQRTCYS